MKMSLCTLVLAVALSTAGCVGFDHSSSLTTPSTTASAVSSLMGTWASVSDTSIIPDPNTCTNFHWNATQQTSTSAAGSFSATCAGNLQVQGTAQGTLSGTTVTWNATGTASTPSITSCAITLSGTAELGTNSIRVPYSGTTCLGPVSGVEVLNKN